MVGGMSMTAEQLIRQIERGSAATVDLEVGGEPLTLRIATAGDEMRVSVREVAHLEGLPAESVGVRAANLAYASALIDVLAVAPYPTWLPYAKVDGKPLEREGRLVPDPRGVEDPDLLIEAARLYRARLKEFRDAFRGQRGGAESAPEAG